MRPVPFLSSLLSATLLASLAGWTASLLVIVANTALLSERPSAGAWAHAGLAAALVPLACAGACALWLGLGVQLERSLAEPARGRPRAYALRLTLLSLPLLGLPAYALAWAITSKTTAWRPGVSPWLFALAALAQAPPARLLLGLAARALRKIARQNERLAAFGLVLLALLGFGGWAFFTAPLRERYGASQLLGYGVVTAALTLALFAWFERRGTRSIAVPAGALVGLNVLAGAALVTEPSRGALELFHVERPTRWFARALVAALPDADADLAPPNLGFLRGGDCDDARADRSPFAFDVPGNGSDENCFAGDSLSSLPATAAIAGATTHVAPAAPAPLNVLVLGLDSVRFDPRHETGVDPRLMPELARLAGGGYAFRDFRTCAPRTRESVTDLLAARPGPNEPNAVQALADRGVHTAFIASDWLARHAAVSGFAERRQPRARYGAFADGEVLAELLSFLNGPPRQPFFLFSHFLGAHEPYETGGACSRDALHPYARYECALSELDRKLGNLLAALRQSGLAERTVIAVTADHGEEFGEHGGRYHATTLYDEVLRVPLVMRAPGAAPARITTPLSCFDFLPTLLGAAGYAGGIAARGRDGLRPQPDDSFAQFARTRPLTETAPFEPKQHAVVHANYKLLWDRATGVAIYFDLTRDPGETRPLPGAPAPIQARLLALMDAWLSDQAAARGAEARLSLSRPH